MRKVKTTTNNKYIIIDDKDFRRVSKYKWYFPKGRTRYVRTEINNQMVYLHHFLFGKPPVGMVSDHKNGDVLDNRKENIRFCTQAQNRQNSKLNKRNTSGYKGVSKRKNGKWKVEISVNGKRLYLGSYENIIEAAYVYNEAAQKYYGEFAKINQI